MIPSNGQAAQTINHQQQQPLISNQSQQQQQSINTNAKTSASCHSLIGQQGEQDPEKFKKRKLQPLIQSSSEDEDADLLSADDETSRAGTAAQPLQPVGASPTTGASGADAEHAAQQLTDNSAGRPKRNPFCSRCRNHGKSAQVKGHKRHCEYRDCQCEGCQLVECRQIVSAAQIRRRRYQKQDEECGRRIEISPPVLKREPANDPATLIAKTLVGTSTAKNLSPKHSLQTLGHHPTASHTINGLPTPTAATVATNHCLPPSQQHHARPLVPSGLHSAPSSASSALTADSSSEFQALPAVFSQHQHLPAPMSSSSFNNQHPFLNYLSHLNDQPPPHSLILPSAHQITLNDQHGANATVQNNALHLMNRANSIMSHAAAFAGLAGSGSNPAGAGAQAASQTTSLQQQIDPSLSCPANKTTHSAGGSILRPTPSFQLSSSSSVNSVAEPHPSTTTNGTSIMMTNASEQLSIVEEMYNFYGPMAIFAWLQAERFDLQKVRDTVEKSRTSFNCLLDLNFKYRLNSNHSNNEITTNSNNNQFQTLGHTHTNTNGLSDTNRSSSSSSSTATTTITDGTDISHTDQTRNKNSTQPSSGVLQQSLHRAQHQSDSKPATSSSSTISPTISSASMNLNRLPTSSSSPLQAAIANIYCNNGTSAATNYINGANDNQHVNSVAAAAAAAAHYNPPLTTPLNILPTTSAAQSLLWTGLKFTTNGVANSVIHPHHLLSPFIQHPFLPHQAYNHQHHHHHQISPASATITSPSSTDKTSH